MPDSGRSIPPSYFPRAFQRQCTGYPRGRIGAEDEKLLATASLSNNARISRAFTDRLFIDAQHHRALY